MTDEEVICTFMEPRPKDGETDPYPLSLHAWWKSKWSVINQMYRWWPNEDKTSSLDALWEVEERIRAREQFAANSIPHNPRRRIGG